MIEIILHVILELFSVEIRFFTLIAFVFSDSVVELFDVSLEALLGV
jgi:hypothetical protein